MSRRISIVDIVHKMFQGNFVDICKKGEEYFLSTRLRKDDDYQDGREVLYTFDVTGKAHTRDILEGFGMEFNKDRPFFLQGDKELVGEFLLEELKENFPDFDKAIDPTFTFKRDRGISGYSPKDR